MSQQPGATKEVFGIGDSGGVLPMDTDELAVSLHELTGELEALFVNIRTVGGFVLEQVAIGVEISAEVAHGARSLIEEQVANGVAVRMAVLYLLLRGRKPE